MDAAGPGGAAATNAARPVLSGAVAQRALFSLQEAVEVVLQFIEQTTCEEEEEQAAAAAAGGAVGGASPLRRALLLAALRALARCACAAVGCSCPAGPVAGSARLLLSMLPALTAPPACPTPISQVLRRGARSLWRPPAPAAAHAAGPARRRRLACGQPRCCAACRSARTVLQLAGCADAAPACASCCASGPAAPEAPLPAHMPPSPAAPIHTRVLQRAAPSFCHCCCKSQTPATPRAAARRRTRSRHSGWTRWPSRRCCTSCWLMRCSALPAAPLRPAARLPQRRMMPCCMPARCC